MAAPVHPILCAVWLPTMGGYKTSNKGLLQACIDLPHSSPFATITVWANLLHLVHLARCQAILVQFRGILNQRLVTRIVDNSSELLGRSYKGVNGLQALPLVFWFSLRIKALKMRVNLPSFKGIFAVVRIQY